eukprot:TRINITY_DN17595_c0_g1_i2.p1 TRINITY_DN17595_c0_g1~~TRINITY_DN17595_c0_g1_i2.p1  ORF type:complete len:716 (+),score=114.01 TRINITY_DN17595_c0_g1_i2:125-2149(+)
MTTPGVIRIRTARASAAAGLTAALAAAHKVSAALGAAHAEEAAESTIEATGGSGCSWSESESDRTRRLLESIAGLGQLTPRRRREVVDALVGSPALSPVLRAADAPSALHEDAHGARAVEADTVADVRHRFRLHGTGNSEQHRGRPAAPARAPLPPPAAAALGALPPELAGVSKAAMRALAAFAAAESSLRQRQGTSPARSSSESECSDDDGDEEPDEARSWAVARPSPAIGVAEQRDALRAAWGALERREADVRQREEVLTIASRAVTTSPSSPGAPWAAARPGHCAASPACAAAAAPPPPWRAAPPWPEIWAPSSSPPQRTQGRAVSVSPAPPSTNTPPPALPPPPDTRGTWSLSPPPQPPLRVRSPPPPPPSGSLPVFAALFARAAAAEGWSPEGPSPRPAEASPGALARACDHAPQDARALAAALFAAAGLRAVPPAVRSVAASLASGRRIAWRDCVAMLCAHAGLALRDKSSVPPLIAAVQQKAAFGRQWVPLAPGTRVSAERAPPPHPWCLGREGVVRTEVEHTGGDRPVPAVWVCFDRRDGDRVAPGARSEFHRDFSAGLVLIRVSSLRVVDCTPSVQLYGSARRQRPNTSTDSATAAARCAAATLRAAAARERGGARSPFSVDSGPRTPRAAILRAASARSASAPMAPRLPAHLQRSSETKTPSLY